MDVLNALKPGLDEKLYERALVIELKKRGHKVDHQQGFPVLYDGQLIGTLVPDLIVDDLVIVDPKVVTAFHESHMAQMRLFEHYGSEVGTPLEFQERQARMEEDRPLIGVVE
jgi:GxxExxY protein